MRKNACPYHDNIAYILVYAICHTCTLHEPTNNLNYKFVQHYDKGSTRREIISSRPNLPESHMYITFILERVIRSVRLFTYIGIYIICSVIV